MRSTSDGLQAKYATLVRSRGSIRRQGPFRVICRQAMAPKRVRVLVAPARARPSREPRPARRARTLLPDCTARRTPSPVTTNHCQRVLTRPKLLARRLGRTVWPPASARSQGGKSALLEKGLHFGSETSSATTSSSSGPGKKRSRVLENRTRRRRKVITTMLADGDVVPNMTYLEQVAVTVKTSRRYRKAIKDFLRWASHIPKGLLAEESELDAALVAYMDELFLGGLQPDLGEVLLAGVLWKMPEFGRYGQRKLARSWRALKGWRKKCPARSRRPHALALWSALAWEMCRMGAWIMAVYLVFTLSTYMRPSEPLLILCQDLVPPTPGVSREWHVSLFPEERAARSKTYAVNDSFCLSSSICPFLPQLLETLLESRKPDELLFPFSYADYLVVFDQCRRAANLPKMVPYQSRHSGPAVDIARGFRDRAGVKERGRWRDDRSVQRYEQRARLGQSFQQLTPALKAHVLLCEERLGALMCGRLQPEDLIWHRTSA